MGWAVGPDGDDRRSVIQILADGIPVGLTVADIFDENLLNKGYGDGCHAFAFPLNPAILEHACRITAQFANLNLPLRGSLVPPHAESAADKPNRMLGAVTHLGGLRLSGWVWDPSTPTSPKKIVFYEKSRRLESCVADQPSAELRDKGFGSGLFGFVCTLPSVLADGQRHRIRAMVDDVELAKFWVQTAPLAAEASIETLLSHPDITNDAQASAYLRLLQAERDSMRRIAPKSLGFDRYAEWLHSFGPAGETPPSATPPRFLVIVEGQGKLADTLSSLDAQQSVSWQAIALDDPASSVADSRLKRVAPARWNGALQAAMAEAGDYVAVIGCGDTLHPLALSRLAQAMSGAKGAHYAYADCDGPSQDDDKRFPWLKPDWDPHYQAATGYASHFFACRRDSISPFASSVRDGRDVSCLALANGDENGIAHISEVLGHHAAWPSLPDPEQKAYQAMLGKLLPGACWIENAQYPAIRMPSPTVWPMVTLIIPTRDRLDLLEPCITSLLATDYPALEILVADNGSCEKETLDYLKTLARRPGCRVIQAPGAFNFSRINNQAVAAARGELIAFINNDIESTDPQWLKTLVAHLHAPGVAAVGAKLLWPNGMVQHGGVVVGLNGVAGHIGNQWFKDDSGYFGINRITRRVGAVTAACLLMRRQEFLDVGQFDADFLQVNFNDLDLCLRLRERGRHILWAADVQLIHRESASRGHDYQHNDKAGRAARETHAILDRWGARLNDPYYNRNLNLDHHPYAGLAIPPRKHCP